MRRAGRTERTPCGYRVGCIAGQTALMVLSEDAQDFWRARMDKQRVPCFTSSNNMVAWKDLPIPKAAREALGLTYMQAKASILHRRRAARP